MNCFKRNSNSLRAALLPSSLFVTLLFAVALTAQAGGSVPITTDPAEPRANQNFDVVYTLESCGDTFPGNSPQNRTVDVVGNVVRITALYALQLCADQPYKPSYQWRIGPLPAGTYQLELEGYTLMGGPENAFPIASGEVTITPVFVAPAPNVVPANGAFALWSLILLVASAALWGACRK